MGVKSFINKIKVQIEKIRQNFIEFIDTNLLSEIISELIAEFGLALDSRTILLEILKDPSEFTLTNSTFTEEQVLEAIKSFNQHKAVGLDNISKKILMTVCENPL